MTTEALECAEIRRIFVAGRVPAGPDVEAHLQGCANCRELFENDARLGRQLAQAVLPEVEPGDLFARIDAELSRDVGARAQLRALPTRVRAALWSAAAAALVAGHLLLRPRPDLATYSQPVFGLEVLWLGAALGAGAVRLLRGPSAPLGAAERALPVILLLVTALGAALIPLGASSLEPFVGWGHPDRCFAYGAALATPLLVLYWLFERRDRPPVTALLTAGALAGVAANLLLFAHCPSAHPGHLLLGHVTVGAAWALALTAAQQLRQPAR
jgi:hypothetical protein